MLSTEKKTGYQAFGLNILSEINIPEFIELQIVDSHADVEVELGDLSNLFNENQIPNNKFIVKENFVMFQVPKVATYLIQDGKKIIISPMYGSDFDRIRLYLISTCMAALLLQRRVIPLHGSAVAINGKAYAIIGDSGSGKSTLAKAFLDKGYQLLSDDLVAVSLTEENNPIVTPGFPQQKLWQETLGEFGMDTNIFSPIFQRKVTPGEEMHNERTKFSIPVSQFIKDPIPLAGVIELVITDSKEIEISPVQKLNRLNTLYYHTFRRSLMPTLGLLEWHFITTTKFVNKVSFHQLRRPVSHFTAKDLPSNILETLKLEV